MKQIKLAALPLMIMLILSGCARMPTSSAPNTTNKTARRIYQVLPAYADAASERWRSIDAVLPLKEGEVSPAVPLIRHRLIVLNDLDKRDDSDSQRFDFLLAQAVRRFQWRHGIQQTGVVNQKTLTALNVSPAVRYRELVNSMNEWAKLPEDEGSRYVHVNVPSFYITLVNKGQHVMEMKVIAGRADRPTPTLYSKIKTIVFNPHWNVPKTIVSQDVIPGMRQNPNYLKAHHNMKLYASWDKNASEIDPLTVDWKNARGSTFRYRITAPPGDDNPLGRVKFVFENEHDVYMHDTPMKELFNQIERAYSSGCIRLEDSLHLVSYFYANNSDLSPELVNQYLSTNQTKYISLKDPIPVYVTYITAWADEEGTVHFREDIYQAQQARMKQSLPMVNRQ